MRKSGAATDLATQPETAVAVETVNTATGAQSAIAERDKQRREAYRELTAALARGEQVAIDEIEATVRVAGRVLSDLDGDVELMRKRIALADTAGEEAAAKRERDEWRAKLRELIAEHAAAVEAFKARRSELRRAMHAADDRLRRACDAKAALARTQPDFHPVAHALAEARARRRVVVGEISSGDGDQHALRKELERLERRIADLERQAATP